MYDCTVISIFRKLVWYAVFVIQVKLQTNCEQANGTNTIIACRPCLAKANQPPHEMQSH